MSHHDTGIPAKTKTLPTLQQIARDAAEKAIDEWKPDRQSSYAEELCVVADAVALAVLRELAYEAEQHYTTHNEPELTYAVPLGYIQALTEQVGSVSPPLEGSTMPKEEKDLGAALGTDPHVPAVTETHPTSEICICAAIRFKDGTIIRGHRHDSCYKTAMGIPALNDYLHQAEQGFVTSANRFVDRGTAWCLQRDAGLVSADPGGYRGEILFSEDLY